VEVLPSGKGENEHFGVTMAKPLWSHAQGMGREKKFKFLNVQPMSVRIG
jgi:hypothetical protein